MDSRSPGRNCWKSVVPPKRVNFSTARRASSGVVTSSLFMLVRCCSSQDSTGLTTAGSPTSYSAASTPPTSFTFIPLGTPIPNFWAIPCVCSLFMAIPRAGSLASATRTFCSNTSRCRRMNAIVPSEEVISTRAPVESSICSRYVR